MKAWRLHLTFLILTGIAPLGTKITRLNAENYTYISGVIVDSSAASVPGALVSVVNEDTGLRRTALTHTDGSYVVSPLERGAYKVIVRKDGFRSMIRFGVELDGVKPGRADFKLVVGSVLETITVEGSAPLLGREDASVGTLVTANEIGRLPINRGSLLSLLELAPGVVVTPATRGESGQFTVNGQRPNTHYFTVDGVSANSGVSAGGLPAQTTGGTLPGMTAFGSLDNLVSLDAIDEMQVQTSTTAPEFGRLPGAQVELTSRSGSNEFHGSLLYAFRNEALDANDWFANERGYSRAPLRMNDAAATLGGPVFRNRTFFFLSYEGMQLEQPFVWQQPTPSADARAGAPEWVQPLLNLFPAPNGPELGNGLALWTANIARPSRLNAGAARLDQAITSRVSAFARYSNSPSSTEFGSNPVNFLDLTYRSLTAGVNYGPTADLVFGTRANYSIAGSNSVWRQPDPPLPPCFAQPVLATLFSTAPCDALLRLSISGVGQVVAGSEGRREQSQFQLSQTAGWSPGKHSLTFGVDYLRLTPVRRDAVSSVSIIADSINQLTQTGSLWKANSPLQNTSGRLQEVSLYAADTWRVSPRLTATYGLRWEISPGPAPGEPANFLDPGHNTPVSALRPLWNTSYSNLAPRFGVAYRLNKSGRTVIRAGGGFYYDSSLSLATDLINDGPLNVSQYGNVDVFVTTLIQFGFASNLKLPFVTQWNVTFDQQFSDHDALSVSYVGSSGRRLIRREIGGAGSTNTLLFALATNNGAADYHGLDVQYHRRLSRGVQALASYSWSHSIDNSSSDNGLYWAGPGVSALSDRASSDFDVRQSLTAGVTWDLPGPSGRLWPGLLRGWSIDGMFRARTGFPITVLDAEQYQGIGYDNVFRPNYVFGQPVWISDASAPGGRRLDPNAFQAIPGGVQGNLGRNAFYGFGMSQFDLALRRELFRRERRSLLLRIEAFNALNHANFADPVQYLSGPLFGRSPSMLNLMLGTGSPASGLAPVFQAGGARSIQALLRFRF